MTNPDGVITATSRFSGASPALLLIDLQVGVTNSGMDLVPLPVESVLQNSARFVEAFRDANLPVIFVRVNYGADNELQVRVQNDWGVSFSPPPGWDEIDPRSGLLATDTVVTKHAYSAFHGTDLDLRLRRQGIDTLVVGGIATHQGVEATVRAAHDHGYSQVFVADAMGAFTPAQHDHPIEQIFPLFGSVSTTTAVIDELAAK